MDATQASANAVIAQFVLLLLTALGALATAIYTARATDATRKAARGSALLNCLDKYVSIRKDRRKAIDRKSQTLAEEYYREILDLHWSEYHLWKERVIPSEVMFSWMQIRRRNFNSDAIEVQIATGQLATVTYKEQWQKLTARDNYFEQNDPFVRFMSMAHNGEIVKVTDLEKLRKTLK